MKPENIRLLEIIESIRQFNEDCPYANHPAIFEAVELARNGGQAKDLGDGL